MEPKHQSQLLEAINSVVENLPDRVHSANNLARNGFGDAIANIQQRDADHDQVVFKASESDYEEFGQALRDGEVLVRVSTPLSSNDNDLNRSIAKIDFKRARIAFVNPEAYEDGRVVWDRYTNLRYLTIDPEHMDYFHKEQEVNEDSEESGYQDFIDTVKSSFLKYFPNGWFSAKHSKNFGESISIRVGSIGDINDVSSKIRENDPMLCMFSIWVNAGNFEVELSRGGYISINPPAGSHLAMEHAKVPFRKFKTSDLGIIAKKLDMYFAKLQQAFKANWDNIYGVSRINPKYLPESEAPDAYREKHYSDVIIDELIDNGWEEEDNSSPRLLSKVYRINKAEDRSGQFKQDVNALTVEASFETEYDRYLVITTGAGEFEIGDIDCRDLHRSKISAKVDEKVRSYILKHYKGSDIQEASTTKSVNINQSQLLDFSTILAKFPNDIRLQVKGKNSFQLTLQKPELLKTNKEVARIFGAKIDESITIQEDGEEVFKSEKGKVISSIKDGRRIFTAYNDEGSIISKPFSSKTVAVTALNKTV